MDLKGDIIYSKALWVIISGTNTNASEDVVSHELKRARDQLLEGLNHFKDPSKESEKEFKSQVSDAVFKFTMRLKRFLGLYINQAWDFMCNYLLYEFRGAEEGLQEFICSETRTTVLLSDIWLFYRSERLFLLKCVNVLLTFHNDKGHPYQKLFANILCLEEQPSFFNSLISQLEKLLSLDYPTPETNGGLISDQFQNLWVMAVLREELELVQNLLLYVDSCEVQFDSFLKLFKTVLQHNFGQDHVFGVLLNETHTDIVKKITNMEIVLILRAVEVLGENGSLWKSESKYKVLEEIMLKLGNQQEHGPINMAWMLVNATGPNSDELFDNYRQFGERALKAGCFVYLDKILRHKMFKESARFSNIAFQTVYRMLGVMTNKFEPERLDGIDGIYSLTAATLMHSNNYTDVFEKPHDEGVFILIQEAAKHYPQYFTVFSKIIESLSSCGPKYIHKLMEYLSHLQGFSEVLEPRVLTTQMVENPPGQWTLTSAHRPMDNVSFIIKPGTKGVFNEENPSIIVWNCTYSFFYSVHHEIQQLISQAQTGGVRNVTVSNVISALKCMTNVLNSKCKILDEMIKPLELVFILVDRFCQLSNPPSKLLSSCLDCMMALLAFSPEEVCIRISKLQFLPGLYYYNPTLTECIRAEHINLFTIGTLVVTQERSSGKYPLLKSYLRFIHRLMKPGVDVDDLNSSTTVIDEDAVQNQIRLVLPGVVFMLRDVFPNYMFWRYVDERDREMIALSCMQMIHQLLNLNLSKEYSTEANKPICLLYRACLYSLLFLDAGTALLRIVGSGDHYIQALMEQQVSWAAGRGLTFIRVVQLALSVLNRLMILKQTIKEEDKPCPLELNIYTQPSQKHGLKIVLVVANYIYHCFNPNLPALAMKLLRRFAMDMPKALMSCMGMKPDVVRHTFVARLNSEVESVALKVALLELVTACIEHQPALADAFLNVYHPAESKRMFQKKQKEDVQGGCLIFACSILSSINQNPELFTGLLYQAVMDLIHALWIGHKEFVLNFLRSREDFWDGFCAPLFRKPSENVAGYSQVFDIIALELYWYGGKVDPNLERNLKIFFHEGDHLQEWSKFITDSLAQKRMSTELASEEMYSQSVLLATAWKDFLIVVMKHLPFDLYTHQKYVVANDTREALIQVLEEMSTMKPIVLLAELCLILTTKWGRETIKNTKSVLTQLHKILYHLSLSYDAFHIRVKEASLAYALRLVHLLRREIREDSITADCLMQASCQIVGIEVHNLPSIMKSGVDTEQQQNKDDKIKSDKSESEKNVRETSLTCTLSLCLMQKLLNILAWSKGWQENFCKCKVVSKVLSAIGHVLQMPEQFNFAVTLMNVLLVLSQTEFAKSIIHSGVMQHLWMQLLPPAHKFSQQLTEQIATAPAPDKTPKHWTQLNWPRVYKPALEMITVLLQSEKHMFLDDVITFMGIHEEQIIASILGIRYSLEKWPLDLAVTALTLIRELSQYKYTWRLTHEKSMFTIMKAVMVCLSSCVSYLIHPRILKIMVEHPPVASTQHLKAMTADDPEISPHLVSIQNRLLDIVCLCMATLIPYSPSIVSLLTDFRECDVEWEPLVEVTFTAPTLIFSKPSPQEEMPSLTFGSLITFANLCTSALGKTSRMPSPGIGRYVSCPLSGGVAIASGLNATWVLTMDKYRITMGLELSLALIASQGIMYLMDHRLSQWEKQLIKREIGAEMALFLEYAKRNLRYFRDGTESSRSGTDGFSWNRFPGLGAAMPYSKSSYPPGLSSDERPNVVRRLWPGSEPRADIDSESENKNLNRSLEGESVSSRKITDGYDTTFGIAGSDGSRKQTERGTGEDQELESESTEQNLDFTSPTTSKSRSGIGSKRSWTSAAVSNVTPAEKPDQSPVALPSDEIIRNIPISQFGISEDYFRLMAHIFNCIFR